MIRKELSTKIKEHAPKIIIGTLGTLAIGTLCVVTKKKLSQPGYNGHWEYLTGISDKIRNARKWISNDEWNGVVACGMHKVTLDEVSDIGKKVLTAAGLKEDEIIEEIVFITTKDK